MHEKLSEIKTALEQIVVTEGEDRGVVLLSNEAPMRWDDFEECYVYEHQHFSPLGDSLVKLHEMVAELEDEAFHEKKG